MFQLKDAVGLDTIRAKEEDFTRRAIDSWRKNPRIWVLGNPDLDRLSIVSMCVRYQGEQFLHWNFVVALLNDLFGIQARGGCSCAGPYGHSLFQIDQPTSCLFEVQTVAGFEGLKPGWFRVNLNYFITERAFQYIVDAVHMVATDGWKLLPFYGFDPRSGLWTHKGARNRSILSLHDLSYVGGELQYDTRRSTEPEAVLDRYLQEARRILDEAPDQVRRLEEVPEIEVSEEFEKLRWFVLPTEVRDALMAGQAQAG